MNIKEILHKYKTCINNIHSHTHIKKHIKNPHTHHFIFIAVGIHVFIAVYIPKMDYTEYIKYCEIL